MAKLTRLDRALTDTPSPSETQIEDIVISHAEAGERLDRVLARRIARLSRSRLKALVLAGQVLVGARAIRDPGYRVEPNERISVTVPAPEPARPEGENIPLDIVFEDDEIIVINKPRGLVVASGRGTQRAARSSTR